MATKLSDPWCPDVSTPVFLIHGVGRYPGSDQSELFAQALQNHYKPVRYETYDGRKLLRAR